MAVLGLHCHAGSSLVSAGGGSSLVALRSLLILAAPLVAEQSLGCVGFSSRSSRALEDRLHSCSTACGIVPDQGTKPCLLHWQADSLSLSHQGSPSSYIYIYILIWLCLVLVAACGLFSCSLQGLVPCPEIRPRPPALGVWSLSH